MVNIFAIDSYTLAKKDINIILDKGEGARGNSDGLSPYVNDSDDKLARYFIYSQMTLKKEIVVYEGEKKGFAYSADPIFIDIGTHNMQDAPSLVGSSFLSFDETRKQVVMDSYVAYKGLVGAMHTAFSEEPKKLQEAINHMLTLASKIKLFIKTPIKVNSTIMVGPSFRAV